MNFYHRTAFYAKEGKMLGGNASTGSGLRDRDSNPAGLRLYHPSVAAMKACSTARTACYFAFWEQSPNNPFFSILSEVRLIYGILSGFWQDGKATFDLRILTLSEGQARPKAIPCCNIMVQGQKTNWLLVFHYSKCDESQSYGTSSIFHFVSKSEKRRQ
jgi:hypothetical protein